MDQNGNASERREGGEEVSGGAEASEECGVAETRAYRAEHRSKEARLLVDAEHDARRSGSTRLGEGEARGVDEVAADPSSAPALANAVVGSSAAAAGVAARRSGASAMETRPTRMAPTGPKASMTLLTELCGLRGVA